MTDNLPPLWFDIVNDLAAHVDMIGHEKPVEGAAMEAILQDAIRALLALRSNTDLDQMTRWPFDEALEKALRREQAQRRVSPG